MTRYTVAVAAAAAAMGRSWASIRSMRPNSQAQKRAASPAPTAPSSSQSCSAPLCGWSWIPGDMARLALALHQDFPREYAYFATDEFEFRVLDARRPIDVLQEDLRSQVQAFLSNSDITVDNLPGQPPIQAT